MNNAVYQEIFNEFAKYLPRGWEKLIVYLEYGMDSYTFSFYALLNGNYVKCYDLPGIDEEALLVSYKKIDSIISGIRNKEVGEWTNMTMIVDNEGKMKSEFDYTDLMEEGYQFKKNWKKKYLTVE